MNKLKEKLYKARSDKGDSNTISALFVTVLILLVTITILDVSIMFLNRNMVANATGNGARLVSVMGGTSDKNVPQDLLKAKPDSCKNRDSIATCQLEEELQKANLIGVTLGSSGRKTKDGRVVKPNEAIKCGPEVAKKIGERAYCEVTWTYSGLPGSAMSFIKYDSVITTSMSAESETVYEAGGQQ